MVGVCLWAVVFPDPTWEHEVGQRLFAFIQPCIPKLVSAVTDVFPLKVSPEIPAGPVGELE